MDELEGVAILKPHHAECIIHGSSNEVFSNKRNRAGSKKGKNLVVVCAGLKGMVHVLQIYTEVFGLVTSFIKTFYCIYLSFREAMLQRPQVMPLRRLMFLET
jgi:hypothetical protein